MSVFKRKKSSHLSEVHGGPSPRCSLASLRLVELELLRLLSTQRHVLRWLQSHVTCNKLECQSRTTVQIA